MHWRLLSLSVPLWLQAASAASDDAHDVGFDYIVVGGGLTGVVMAARLSENPSNSVLLLEAGPLDAGEPFITIPGLAGGAIGGKYDWNLTTSVQPQLANRSLSIPAGKVIGGGSVLNGMLWQRGAKADYDIWRDLGNPGWGWDDLLPYFKKSETYTPPTKEQLAQVSTKFFGSDFAVRGTHGPIHSSYSNFQYPAADLFDALTDIGLPSFVDGGGNGNTLGGFMCPSSEVPRNESRSYARNSYFKSAAPRSNLKVLVEHTVTKILTSNVNDKVVATGVSYVPTDNTSSEPMVAKASKEVIIAAGSMHTPQLLQLSGIGPRKLLQNLGIDVVIDLPGVGSNFQDHALIFPGYNVSTSLPSIADLSNATFAAEQMELYLTKRQGRYTWPQGNSVAYLPLPDVSERSDRLLSQVLTQNSTLFLPPSYSDSSELLQGYLRQRDLLVDYYQRKKIPVEELLFGSGASGFSTQHTFSRGSITISSTDPLVPPVIDIGWYTNPIDIELSLDSFKFNRKLKRNPQVQVTELVPGLNATDDQIRAFFRQVASTFAHPSCSCPMQPRDLGGCIDPNLLVWGSKNLRIIDASVLPLIPGTHLQSTMYAIAEKAADIVKGNFL